MTNRLPDQQRKTKRRLTKIENYEHIFEHSAYSPIQFLFFLKRNRVSNLMNTLELTKHALLSQTEETKMDDVNELGEIQIIETGKRQVSNECLLKQMSKPLAHRSLKIIGIGHVSHISFVSYGRVWINDCWEDTLLLTNTAGDRLYHITDQNIFSGVHTVNTSSDLIYIDKYDNINKLSKDYRKKSILIKKTTPWEPRCIYCSPSNGDLLVGMYKYTDTDEGKVVRYNSTGKHIQKIKYKISDQIPNLITKVHNRTHLNLYSKPIYITENRNGDVIVSDILRSALVVTEHGGRYRFSYKGPPSKSRLEPLGICTDALLNILVCDANNHTVQMIDKDGNFLSLLLTQDQGIYYPGSLSYDYKAHLLWVGTRVNNRVRIYRYIERQS
ncbi:uncharacterized protein LOC134269229 [Saccostrea cucullata]